MIDNISGGRLIAGIVVGGGPEYYSLLDQPGARPRALPGGARHHHQGVDRARADRVHRQALQAPLREHRGRGRCSSRTPRSGSRARARSRRWSSSPGTATPTWASRTSTSASSSASSACSGRPATREGYTYDPMQAGWLVPDLRGRDRRAGAGRVRAALLVLRPQAAARHRRSARPATRRCGRSRTSSRARHVRADARDVGPGRRRPSTPSSARRTPSTSSSWRTSSGSGPGNLLGLFQLGTPPGRPHPAQPRAVRRPRSCRVCKARFPEGEAILQQLDPGAGLTWRPSYVDTRVGKVQYRRGGCGTRPGLPPLGERRGRGTAAPRPPRGALRRRRARCSRASATARGSTRSTTWRTPPSTSSTFSIGSTSSVRSSSARRSVAGWPPRWRRATPSGSSVSCSSTPLASTSRARRSRTSSAARSRRWSPTCYYDQQHPMAQLMLQFAALAADRDAESCRSRW